MTIKDVANLSGVSSSTVSRYLRGQLSVSPQTERSIQSALEALNYVPNANPRGLASQRNCVVGLVLPSLSNPFFAALADRVADELTRLSVSLLLCTTRDNRRQEENYTDLLDTQAVDGMLYLGAHPFNSRLRRVIERGLPVVVVDEPLDNLPPVTMLTVDNFAGGYQATSYLLGMGHTRIAYLGGPPGLGTEVERHRGYAEALARAGLSVDKKIVFTGSYSERFGVATLPHLLMLKNRPTAVFCASDHTALGLMSAAHTHGLRLPEDLSVVGFDDIGVAGYTTPGLTSIRQPVGDIAKQAVELLMARIDNPSAPPERRVLPVELIVRESAIPHGRRQAPSDEG